ncbi:cytochrome c oxidase subunit 2A [Variovorax ginsengisoli]|uniref:Mannose/fructose/N-acetylgalactosamine-specific phosphotransferase system component IID n=1 Tax=Variovorax ginsengisoli TaxID=363844 RepID=A0ABT9SCG9_9BURK|nr:cytochrome c oxidase subunit 2A [Variovorax ginsengisoli]MDP9902025.1 mannose/fructose/N-acetylgalactosamine-specific phosphotransferase system component IID [Variovorax ginsengisoli]
MRRAWVSHLVILWNLPQILVSAATATYAIWFADYEQRNVGPVVSQAAETILVILVTQILNLVIWWVLRKRPTEVRLLGKIVVFSLVATILLFWLGSHFIYAGRG